MEVHQEISKWGNSLGVRIPSVIADSLGLHPGDDVSISVSDGTIVIKATHSLSLEEQLGQIDIAALCTQYKQCDPIPDDALALIDDEPVGQEYL